jgi:hypothetical protein
VIACDHADALATTLRMARRLVQAATV